MNWTATLRARLTVGVVLIVLVAAVAVATLALHIAEARMETTIGNQQEALLASATSQLDTAIASKQALLLVLGQAMVTVRDPRNFQGFLEDRSALRDEFSDVTVLNRAGLLIADLGDRRNVGKLHFEHRPYFAKTLQLHEGVVSAPFRSRLSGKPVVVLTQPVLGPGGEIDYIIVASIDLERPAFFGRIDQLSPGRSGYLFALTREGLMLHHPDTWRLLHNVAEGKGHPVQATLDAMHGWQGWTISRNRRGTESLISFRRMRTTDWVVGSVFPVEEAFSSIHDAQVSALLWAACIAVLAGVAAWYTAQRLLTPLYTLRHQVQAVEQGHASIDAFAIDRKDEVGALAAAFHSLSLQREEAERRLQEMTLTDSLTGLGNRRRFEQDIQKALQRGRRAGRPFALAYLDLDQFKRVNDELGHDAGDAVLVEFGRRATAALRSTDALYRLAGDEFVIILDQVDNESAVVAIAEKIMASVRLPFAVPGAPSLQVTTSAGFRLVSDPGTSFDRILKDADDALYRAKAHGRNRYVLTSCTEPDPIGDVSAN